jgi:hypothetical protein
MLTHPFAGIAEPASLCWTKKPSCEQRAEFRTIEVIAIVATSLWFQLR